VPSHFFGVAKVRKDLFTHEIKKLSDRIT